ncbi:MAG: hypothetical protein NTY01_17560 [Verrucomicrobia bacterium]|nr:hypothetical protein [Verrucomicrobiota bacterium]
MKPVTLSLMGLGVVVGLGAFGMERYVGLMLLGWLIGTLGGVPMALVLQAVFPRFLRRTSECLERGPWSSLMVGVLGVLIAWLASHVAGQAHGLGKFLGSIAGIGLAAVTVFGAAAAYRLLGSRMYLSMNSSRSDHAFPSTLLGGVVLSMAVLLPFLGALVFVLALTMGLGAGLIALLGKQPKPPVVSPVPPKLS